MSGRAVAILGLVAGGGALAWWLSQQGAANVYSPVDLAWPGTDSGSGDPQGRSDPWSAPSWGSSDYLSALSRAEDPKGDPYAKNPYSSASGLYQFTKDTWTRLGGDWGPDPTKAFGGLTPSIAEQTARAAQLTASNASLLAKAGVAADNLALYAVHIFGPKAVKVVNADPSTPLASLVGASTVAKNPALGQTVGSFMDYLARKVG